MPRFGTQDWVASQRDFLNRALGTLGMNQSRLATALGLDRSSVSHFMSGRHRMRNIHIYAIRHLLALHDARSIIARSAGRPLIANNEHAADLSPDAFIEHLPTCPECLATAYYMRAPRFADPTQPAVRPGPPIRTSPEPTVAWHVSADEATEAVQRLSSRIEQLAANMSVNGETIQQAVAAVGTTPRRPRRRRATAEQVAQRLEEAREIGEQISQYNYAGEIEP